MKVPNPREDLSDFGSSTMGIDDVSNTVYVHVTEKVAEPVLYTADGVPLVRPRRIGLNS